MTPDRIKNLGIKKAVLDRFENETAVFKFDDGQELRWKRDELPRDFRIGEGIILKLSTSTSENEEREEISRKLLSEILEKTE
ncbi:DUF3006 family protein [Patescibacteria group bacterium]